MATSNTTNATTDLFVYTNTEPHFTGHLAQGLLDRLGNPQIEADLDRIRRQSLTDGKPRLAEEARAWLEFSRATERFYRRLRQKMRPA
jgi:hypothetical protein